MRYGFLLALTLALLFTPSRAHAQGTAYATDGRPEFCVLADIGDNRALSREMIGTALDNLGYSRIRGPGLRVMNNAQRMVGWVFYIYSQDTVHWDGYYEAGAALGRAVEAVVTQNNGDVTAMSGATMASFRRAANGCGVY